MDARAVVAAPAVAGGRDDRRTPRTLGRVVRTHPRPAPAAEQRSLWKLAAFAGAVAFALWAAMSADAQTPGAATGSMGAGSTLSARAVPFGPPDARLDLTMRDGVQSVQGAWRYSDTKIVEVDFRGPGPDGQPTGAPVKTYDYTPHAGGVGTAVRASPGDPVLPFDIPLAPAQRRGEPMHRLRKALLAVALATARVTIVVRPRAVPSIPVPLRHDGGAHRERTHVFAGDEPRQVVVHHDPLVVDRAARRNGERFRHLEDLVGLLLCRCPDCDMRVCAGGNDAPVLQIGDCVHCAIVEAQHLLGSVAGK